MSDAALRDTPRYLTEAEYVALEKASPIRHEFVDGAMYAMTGTSKRHNLVTCRFTRRLADADAWRHDRAGLPGRRDARRGLAARPLNEPRDATKISAESVEQAEHVQQAGDRSCRRLFRRANGGVVAHHVADVMKL